MRNEPNCVHSRQQEVRQRNHALLPRPRSSPRSSITTSAPSAGSDSISAPEHTETGLTKPEVVIPSSAFIKPVVLSEHGTSTPASARGFMSVYAASTPSTRSLNKRDTDAMTGMIGDPSKSIEFFGSSSAASFMRQINAAIDARLGSSGSNHSSTYPSRTTLSPTDSKVFIDPLAYTLPQRSFADSLVQDYYDLVWVILPVHDWTIFRKAYHSIWLSSSSTIPEHILYCMVNLTFALGSQFSQAVPPSDRREMGQTFWKRAHMLFDPRSNEEACLEGVQCLLLMGLFLQSTCESHQCWMTIGSAIRMAQSLGLHLSSSMHRNESTRELEIARRVWHGCVFMDR